MVAYRKCQDNSISAYQRIYQDVHTVTGLWNKLIFASNRGGNTGTYQLYEMNLDGSDQRLIFADNAMSASPSWSPNGREIFFGNDREEGRNGNFEIFKFAPRDENSLKRLTFRQRIDGEPAVSPDGKRIAFASNSDGNREIYLMNSDGSDLTRITRNPASHISPHWLPDGSGIVFASDRSGKFAIYKIVF